MMERGYKLVSDGTDNHMVLVDFSFAAFSTSLLVVLETPKGRNEHRQQGSFLLADHSRRLSMLLFIIRLITGHTSRFGK
mgnify:CR=1 FL=1